MRELNILSGRVVDTAIGIHRELGPGLMESVYQRVLVRKLMQGGHRIEEQKWVSFAYEGLRFEKAYRIDMLVDGALIVEVKSVEAVAAVHKKQLLTYLRLMDIRLGLLLNFGAPLMKDGVHRVINSRRRTVAPGQIV